MEKWICEFCGKPNGPFKCQFGRLPNRLVDDAISTLKDCMRAIESLQSNRPIRDLDERLERGHKVLDRYEIYGER